MQPAGLHKLVKSDGKVEAPLGYSLRPMAPSRQERRKAERDAAKRAPANAGAAGAKKAAAALANLNVNSLGDWTTQAEDASVGPGVFPPRHRVPFNSRDEGSKCGELRGE